MACRLTGIIGASMAKTQGLMVLQELQQQSQKGIPPTQTIVEGVPILIGGVLFVTQVSSLMPLGFL